MTVDAINGVVLTLTDGVAVCHAQEHAQPA
jgi:hypothetical protein